MPGATAGRRGDELPGCGEATLNLVSAPHLDVPFYHDKVVRYLTGRSATPAT